MWQRGLAHENSIEKLTRKILETFVAAVHFQTLADGLGAAMLTQDGRIGGLEHRTAQLTSSVEALRAFQESQYSGPPPAAFSGGGFPVGGGLSSSSWGPAGAGNFCGD